MWPRERIIREYKYILASLFTPRAVSYRLNMGISLDDIAMSVACLEMIQAVSSGVMYTRHPFNPERNEILINGVWGLGPYAVDGVITPDSFTMAKSTPPKLVDSIIAEKSVKLTASPDGYVSEEHVEEKNRKRFLPE